MLRALLAGVTTASLLVSCHDPVPAPPAPTRAVRPVFFDADRVAPARPPIATTLGGAVTAVDPQRGVPRFVWTRAAAPASLAITPALRARRATSPAAVAALAHVTREAARWGLDAGALAAVEIAHVHDTGRGPIVVKLRQRDVIRTSLSVIMDRQLGLVALSGSLHPMRRIATTSRFAARDALDRAFDDAGLAHRALAAAPDRGGYQRFTGPGVVGPARARRVWFPVGDWLVPAWETELAVRDGHKVAGYRHVFAADDGRLLLRAGLTDDAAFSYRVWADPDGERRFLDGPQGDYTPHPTGAPDGFDPAFVAPALVTVDGLNAAGDPWLPDGATETRGNNVDAYADSSFPDGFSAGDVRASVTAPGVFDRSYDVHAQPNASDDQRMAAVTTLFYVTNWLHDYFYDSGFTEAAGNAQQSNLGRGGVGGDPLHAEGQDASGTDNANMFTPGDGASPVMQMFLFSAPPGGPRRDGTIDSGIISHEWGHYLHHRLVDCGSAECASMSEGWGDFIALFSSVRAGDDLTGTWGMGAYALRAFTANAAYFGIRRYPYSIDPTKSPLTLRFVENGVPLPDGPPTSDIDFLQGGDNWEGHNSGEIWCAMLWEGLVDLLRDPRLTFDDARRRMADYVVAGMIAAPVEPSYTEQRDAILAVAAAADPADFRLLARAFARRGFGTGAVAPPINSFDGGGVVESFDVTGALDVVAVTLEEDAPACDGDGLLDIGETGQLAITVRNAGAETLAGPTISVGSTTGGVVFPAGTTASLGAIAPGASATAHVAIRLDETPVTTNQVAVAVTATDASAAVNSVARTLNALANADVLDQASRRDGFEAPALVWTASADGFARVDVDGQHALAVHVAAAGDHVIQTPALEVGTAPLVVRFLHRHAFATRNGAALDGGVVEISEDGVTFIDVATIVDPGYTGTITGAGNPLAGRAAFTGKNAGGTSFDPVTIDLGTGFAGETVFLRFRAAGDEIDDSSRWELDDVELEGVVNLPFPVLVTETGSCLPGARPIADAGADFEIEAGAPGSLDGTASTDPDGGALTFEWTQVSGPKLTLDDPTAAQPSFTAPMVGVDRIARLDLVVRDPDDRVSAPSRIAVKILAPPGPVDGAPDAGVDAPVDAAVDAADAALPPDAPGPDAGDPGLTGGAGGCCGAGRDGRGALVLALAVIAIGRRRRGRRSRSAT